MFDKPTIEYKNVYILIDLSYKKCYTNYRYLRRYADAMGFMPMMKSLVA